MIRYLKTPFLLFLLFSFMVFSENCCLVCHKEFQNEEKKFCDECKNVWNFIKRLSGLFNLEDFSIYEKIVKEDRRVGIKPCKCVIESVNLVESTLITHLTRKRFNHLDAFRYHLEKAAEEGCLINLFMLIENRSIYTTSGKWWDEISPKYLAPKPSESNLCKNCSSLLDLPPTGYDTIFEEDIELMKSVNVYIKNDVSSVLDKNHLCFRCIERLRSIFFDLKHSLEEVINLKRKIDNISN